MKKFILGSLLLLWACDSQPKEELYLDVRALKGKTPEQVVDILGKPDTTFNRKMITSQVVFQIYREKNIHLKYEGAQVLTSIVVETPELPFAESSITKFGLDSIAPTKNEKNVLINWKNYPDFSNVSIYAKKYNEEGIPSEYDFYFKYKK